MDDKEFDFINKLLQSGDFKNFESSIIKYIVKDAKNNTNHRIIWTQGGFDPACSNSRYDLVGQDLSTGATIYIEIKSKVDRKLLLMTISHFRRFRTVGYNNDLYLYVSLDATKKQLNYYDISTSVKSTEIEIKDEITQAINNPKNSISAFLGKISKDEMTQNRVEVVGDASIPKVTKKNYLPLISKIVSIGAALSFLIVVFVLNFLGIYCLTNRRLILIGMIIIVCLFLFIKEIKIKDWVYLSTIEPKDK